MWKGRGAQDGGDAGLEVKVLGFGVREIDQAHQQAQPAKPWDLGHHIKLQLSVLLSCRFFS